MNGLDVINLLKRGDVVNLELGEFTFDQAQRWVDRLEKEVGRIERAQVIGRGTYISLWLPTTPNPTDPCPCGSGKKYKNCHGRNE